MSDELTYSDRLRLAVDPATPPAQLASLAHEYAELRPLIATNPSAYPGLLEWLTQLGEPAVLTAIASRNAPAPSAPVGNQYTASLSAPADSAAPTDGMFTRPVRDPASPRVAPSRNRVIAITASAVVGLLLVGGGAFAVNMFLGGGTATDSAKAFPASTYAWAEVAIDPSPGQTLAAVQLFSKLPELKNLIDDEGPDIDWAEPDVKHSIWDFVFENNDYNLDTSLSYTDDIKPWLGSRVAMGTVGSAENPQVAYLVAIEATNTELGVKAMLTLLKDRNADGVQVSARNGYVLISSEKLDLTKAFADGTLADTQKFKGSTSRLGSWGLAAYWGSPRGAMESQLAWDSQNSDSLSSTSLQDLKDSYFSDVEYWQREIADYRVDCPRNATYNSYYCGSYSEPTESDFYFDYGYYPDEWESAAKQAYEDSKSEAEDILDSYNAIVESLSPNGSIAGALRITDNAVEFVHATAGLNLPDFAAPQHGAAMSQLPTSTMAAASVSQFGSMVDTAMSPEYYALGLASAPLTGYRYIAYNLSSLVNYDGDKFPKSVSTWRANFERDLDDNLGVRIPDGLTALFGTNAVLAVDKDFSCAINDSTYSSGACSSPNVGVVLYTNDVDKTSNHVNKLLESLDQSYNSELKVTKQGDRLAVSRGKYGASLLESSSQTLAQNARFTAAVPDLAGSFAAAYVDIPAVLSETRNQDAYYSGSQLDTFDYLDGVDSAGVTMTQLGGGDIMIRMRVVIGAG